MSDEIVELPAPPEEDTQEPVETGSDGYATPQTEAPESQDDASVVSAIFGGGLLIATAVQGFIRGQADACQASRELQTWDTNIWRPSYIRAMTRVRNLSDTLVAHIDNVYRTRGRAGGIGQPLELFLAEEFGGLEVGTRALMPWSANLAEDPWKKCGFALALAPVCRLDWIRQHLPLPEEVRDTTLIPAMDENGFEPGVGYHGTPIPGSRYGRLCGTRVREAVNRWKLWVRENSSPASNPRIRQRLTNLVGTWEGTGPYETFSPPTNPEAIFFKSPKTQSGGIFEAASEMPGSVINLPDLDGVCAGVSSQSWVYASTAANGDPILQGSKLYEVIKFRLYQADLRDCMTAICQARGGPDGEAPFAPPPQESTNTETDTGDDSNGQTSEFEIPDWALYAAAALAAFYLA
jgi:hypothetical protein